MNNTQTIILLLLFLLSSHRDYPTVFSSPLLLQSAYGWQKIGSVSAIFSFFFFFFSAHHRQGSLLAALKLMNFLRSFRYGEKNILLFQPVTFLLRVGTAML